MQAYHLYPIALGHLLMLHHNSSLVYQYPGLSTIVLLSHCALLASTCAMQEKKATNQIVNNVHMHSIMAWMFAIASAHKRTHANTQSLCTHLRGNYANVCTDA